MNSKSRFKLTIAYDGTNYVGWQIQHNGLAVQALIAQALHRISGQQIRPVGSGRTDAGVHAVGQVAHIDLPWRHSAQDLQNALNSLLPDDIVIRNVEAVPSDFHAQRSASEKWYRYIISNRPGPVHELPLPFGRHYVWAVSGPLRIGLMRKAAKYLQGRHDFKSFQASGATVKTTVRALRGIVMKIIRLESPFSVGAGLRARPYAPLIPGTHGGVPLLIIDFIGDGFLKQMVRNMVGLLVEVGQGKRPPTDVQRILRAKDRKTAGYCAPPQGLYLMNVRYD